jgi:hypothetical protein
MRVGVAIGVGMALASVVLVVACSSDKPPATGSGPISSSGGGTTSSSGGVDSGGDSSKPTTDAGGDAPPIIPCTNDTSIKIDGGTPPTDCSQSPTCAAHCTNIRDHYKLGVAQTAIACLAKLPNCNTLSDVHACVDLAIGNACPDTAAVTFCTPLVPACDPNAGKSGSNIDEAGCELFANGMSSAGRTAFNNCLQTKISAGTCPVEVLDCTAKIRE